ncbi:ATP-binding protein [Delftia sp. PS-11]|uniref:ATP-binding protein n=1 Tax=Delftia sp. PS-11 TaxID=2767222 RepID=UPI002458A81F|nr:ATP-binding protein [Delftia sp. PS-11]KAJ8742527.1 Hpt domain-containing protein [Delftia sp. PS-11]
MQKKISLKSKAATNQSNSSNKEINSNKIFSKENPAENNIIQLNSVIRAISTPLSSMVGHMMLIDPSHLPPDQQERWQKIMNNSDALMRQISNITEFSDSMRNHRQTKDQMTFDASEIGAKSAAKFFNLAELQKTSVHVRCKQFPIIIHNDQKKIAQLLEHLLENSIQFTRNGKIIIQIEKYTSAPGQMALRVSVKDNGTGIAPGLHGQIFSPFMTTQGHDGHAGLGLALCQNLCKDLNANLWMTSAPEAGSNFIVEIPCEMLDSSDTEANSYQQFFAGHSVVFISPSLEHHDYIIPYLEHWGLNVASYLQPGQADIKHINDASCVIIFEGGSRWTANDENAVVAQSSWTIECNRSNPTTLITAGRSTLINSHSLGSLFKALQQATNSANNAWETPSTTSPKGSLSSHVIDAFRKSLYLSYQNIKSSIDSENTLAIIQELHNLAGSLSSLGMHEVSRKCVQLESVIKAEGLSANIQDIEYLLHIISENITRFDQENNP